MAGDAVAHGTFRAHGRLTRAAFAAGDLLAGSPEERAAAAAGYVPYAGTYEPRARTVIHHVLASLVPNWVGTDRERFVGWDGGRLLLSTTPITVGGRQQTARLVWERVGSEE